MAKEMGGLGGGGGFEKSRDGRIDIISPEEIEEGIISTSTVTWDPFTVLPKEIYVKIFNKLDNPNDKQNFMNANVKWYELFEAERVKFLFGKVMERLTPDGENGSTDKAWIGLRLVCREWDQGIQNYYQLHPDHFHFKTVEEEWDTNSNNLKNHYNDGYLINWEYGYDATELKYDLDEFQASHPSSKNPFLTRKVRIQMDVGGADPGHEESEPTRTLLSHIRTLLEIYGHHIWHFSIHYSSDLTPGIFSEVVKWLDLMPELRTLQMEFQCNFYYGGMRETYALINAMQTELPELRKLQNLHVSGFPCFVFNKLLEGMKALEKVEIGNLPQFSAGFKFPTSLTDLALKLQTHEEIMQLNSLEQFPFVRYLVINMDLVCLQPSLNSEDNLPSWQTVWMAIEEKFPALEELQLNLAMIYGDHIKLKMMEQSLDCRLNLKKLKRLSLTLPTLSSLDFLQEIKTLQELKIKLKNSFRQMFEGSDKVQREIVQFNRDLGTMWESNIWQIFPNLRKLSFQDLGRLQSGSVNEYYSYEKGAG